MKMMKKADLKHFFSYIYIITSYGTENTLLGVSRGRRRFRLIQHATFAVVRNGNWEEFSSFI